MVGPAAAAAGGAAARVGAAAAAAEVVAVELVRQERAWRMQALDE